MSKEPAREYLRENSPVKDETVDDLDWVAQFVQLQEEGVADYIDVSRTWHWTGDENDAPHDTYVLEDAIKTVYERPDQHGEPEDSFETIARLWHEYLVAALDEGDTIDGDDVAMMMALLKIARTAEGVYESDSARDLAGYAECYARLNDGGD